LPITIIYTVSASQLVAGVQGSGRRALLIAMVGAVVVVALSFAPSIVRWTKRGNGTAS
jgi:hypothetical protein